MSSNQFSSISREELHICSFDFLVGVSDSGEEPLGDGSLGAVSTEEIEEDRRVQWLDGTVTEIIVVGLDFGAHSIM